jgi:hypothetical protein
VRVGSKIKQKMMPALSSVKQARGLIYSSTKTHTQLVRRFSLYSNMNLALFISKKQFVVQVSLNNERKIFPDERNWM